MVTFAFQKPGFFERGCLGIGRAKLLLSRCLGEAEAARQEPRPPKGKLFCVYGI